jgi:hypothetical protein
VINNVGQIERGYERIDERLNALGARIERVGDRRTRDAPARPRRAVRASTVRRLAIRAFVTTRAAGTLPPPEPCRVRDGGTRCGALSRHADAGRLATARQVHGAHVLAHDGAWEGWLAARRRTGTSRERGHRDGRVGRRLRARCSCAHPSGAPLLHSGWRGTEANILAGAVGCSPRGAPRRDLRVALGRRSAGGATR